MDTSPSYRGSGSSMMLSCSEGGVGVGVLADGGSVYPDPTFFVDGAEGEQELGVFGGVGGYEPLATVPGHADQARR